MTDVAADDKGVPRYRVTFQFKSGRSVMRTMNQEQFDEFVGESWSGQVLEQLEYKGDNPKVMPLIINVDELESVDVHSYTFRPRDGF
jgi:hypothetical protein